MSKVKHNIFEEIIEKHNSAEITISIFFAAVDFIIYLIINCLFGCDINKKCFSHRQKLSMLILLDSLFRIIYLYITSFLYSFIKELVSSCLASLEFYIILTLLNQMFLNKNIDSLLESPEIKFPFLSSLIFFCFSIVINNFKLLSLLQYIIGVIATLGYGYYISGKVNIFLQNLAKKNIDYCGKHIIHFLPIFIALYFVVYFSCKLLSLIVLDALYLSYLEMGSDIFKEVGKYLSFCLVILIYYLFNKHIKEEDFDFANESNQTPVKISSLSN